MEALISKIEQDISSLEHWAQSCHRPQDSELHNIVIIKIASLSTRLERIRQQIDRCPRCGKANQLSVAYGTICRACNGFAE